MADRCLLQDRRCAQALIRLEALDVRYDALLHQTRQPNPLGNWLEAAYEFLGIVKSAIACKYRVLFIVITHPKLLLFICKIGRAHV